ncbi:Uncharacterised protein r2_g2164 [Pycnogonum litorale]
MVLQNFNFVVLDVDFLFKRSVKTSIGSTCSDLDILLPFCLIVVRRYLKASISVIHFARCSDKRCSSNLHQFGILIILGRHIVPKCTCNPVIVPTTFSMTK